MSSFHKNTLYQNKAWAPEKAKAEIENGLKLLESIDEKIIAFAGSARVKQGDAMYEHCKTVAFELGKKGYAIASGGGPGVMHAANFGATLAKARSIGLKAELLTKEKITDDIYTNTLNFHYFFARRFIMLVKTEAMIFYPGGLGTCNELLENMMLMQNDIVDKIPLYCVNKSYWHGLFNWFEEKSVGQNYLEKADLKLVKLVDTPKELISRF